MPAATLEDERSAPTAAPSIRGMSPASPATIGGTLTIAGLIVAQGGQADDDRHRAAGDRAVAAEARRVTRAGIPDERRRRRAATNGRLSETQPGRRDEASGSGGYTRRRIAPSSRSTSSWLLNIPIPARSRRPSS